MIKITAQSDLVSGNIDLFVSLSKEYLTHYVDSQGLLEEIAKTIAAEIYPEIKKQALEDPLFKDKIATQITLILAKQLLDEAKGLKESSKNE